MSRPILPGIALTLALSVSGCGTTPEDRAVSGAGLGAGAGAVVGALTGLTVLEGAALGGVAGGLTGVLTDANRVNLGAPVWKQGSATAGAPPAAPPAYSGSPSYGRPDTVGRIQSGLARLGYDPGPVDGIPGPRTASAIRAYQHDHGLPVDGQPSVALVTHIAQRGG
jgi:peptidoglycan hydrolase-like protein with peptidoglycan-binding domain